MTRGSDDLTCDFLWNKTMWPWQRQLVTLKSSIKVTWYSSLYFPQLLNSCSCTACHKIQVQLQLLSRLELQLQLKLHYLKMWRINQRVELQLQLRMYLKQLSCSRLVWMRLGTKREPESFKYTVGSGSVFASFLSSKSSTLQVSYPNQSTATELF